MYMRKALAVLTLLLNLKFSLASRSWNTDVGQGVMLNSDRYPSLEGIFDAFFRDEDLVVASSDHVLDWSVRKPTKNQENAADTQIHTEQVENYRRNPKIRSSRATQLTRTHYSERGSDSAESRVVAPSVVHPSQTEIRESNSDEPSSSINFPGGIRVTKFKRKPVMTHYEKLKSGNDAFSSDSQTESKADATTSDKQERPLITVRNHEERSQKIKKRNRSRQKTMKILTTTEVPTTWEYHTPKYYRTTRLANSNVLYSANSKRSPSDEDQIESSREATTTTTKRPPTRPTRKYGTTAVPHRSPPTRANVPIRAPVPTRANAPIRATVPTRANAPTRATVPTPIRANVPTRANAPVRATVPTRANVPQPGNVSNRGSVRYRDTVARESGKAGSRISPTNEEENVSTTDPKRMRGLTRNFPSISRVQREEKKSEPKHDTKGEEEGISKPKNKEDKKNQGHQSFEVLHDKPSPTKNNQHLPVTETIPLVASSTPNQNSNPKLGKQNASKVNVRQNQPPQKPNSQIYGFENPYYPQAFLNGHQNDNGFFYPQIPYQGNAPPQQGYYFNPPTYSPGFGPDYPIPGFHHSPHLLSLRHSILESQKDPSTTTSEPYSFSIPNFRIPTIDYNHKGCKTLLREVKEVPVKPSGLGEYRLGPTSMYMRRPKREVKSIVMTKECFFPEGVPEDAIQNRRRKIPESSTVPIPVTVIAKRRGNTQNKMIDENIPKLRKDSDDAQPIIRKNNAAQPTEDILTYSPTEYRFNPPRYDPVRGYILD